MKIIYVLSTTEVTELLHSHFSSCVWMVSLNCAFCAYMCCCSLFSRSSQVQRRICIRSGPVYSSSYPTCDSLDLQSKHSDCRTYLKKVIRHFSQMNCWTWSVASSVMLVNCGYCLWTNLMTLLLLFNYTAQKMKGPLTHHSIRTPSQLNVRDFNLSI